MGWCVNGYKECDGHRHKYNLMNDEPCVGARTVFGKHCEGGFKGATNVSGIQGLITDVFSMVAVIFALSRP